MFSDTSVLISNTGANLYLIKYKGCLPETLRTLQFCLSLCNLCKEMIYCNFISYNTFIKHSNKISNLCNCTQSLPVLRSRILHYFHRFFSDFFFFFFRLFWGLSWFVSKPIFTMSAVWAWDGSHLTTLYCWFHWKAQENQQTIQMNR